MAGRRAKANAAASILQQQYESDESSDEFLSEIDDDDGNPSDAGECGSDDCEDLDSDVDSDDGLTDSAGDDDDLMESSQSEEVNSSGAEQENASSSDSEDQDVSSGDEYSSNDEGSCTDSDDSTTLYSLPQYISKDGNESWECFPVSSSQGRRNQFNVLHQRPGPTRYAIRECTSLSSSFLLFFRQPLLQEICKWSNKEGQRIYKDNWADISIEEIKKFIGLLILIGVYKSKNEEVSQLWSRTDGRPIFNKIMSRQRFQRILRVLRFDDAASRRRSHGRPDKLQPIKFCFELWNEALREAYVPGESMTVDEQLVTFRGRCPFRQYIPSKPGRYGIKIWAICDSANSYAWKMEIYTGKKVGQQREVNQGERVVLSLTEEVQKSGRNITCDNFFTSVQLARKLLAMKLTLVGTIRRNGKELPASFVVTKGRELFSTQFGFQENVMIGSYCPKKGKVVTMLSTMHSQPDVDHNNEKKKPEMILYYNSTKGGVDTMDQMLRCYSVKRMTRRWPMVIFYNMIDVSALNGYIIMVVFEPHIFCEEGQKASTVPY